MSIKDRSYVPNLESAPFCLITRPLDVTAEVDGRPTATVQVDRVVGYASVSLGKASPHVDWLSRGVEQGRLNAIGLHLPHEKEVRLGGLIADYAPDEATTNPEIANVVVPYTQGWEAGSVVAVHGPVNAAALVPGEPYALTDYNHPAMYPPGDWGPHSGLIEPNYTDTFPVRTLIMGGAKTHQAIGVVGEQLVHATAADLLVASGGVAVCAVGIQPPEVV